MSSFEQGPRLRATVYTDEISENYFTEYRARGYVNGGKVWAVVDVGDLSLTAVGDDGLAGMQRLRDALDTAIARARLAVQDADLAGVSA